MRTSAPTAATWMSRQEDNKEMKKEGKGEGTGGIQDFDPYLEAPGYKA